MVTELDQGRAAFERRDWAEAGVHLRASDGASPLAPNMVEQLAIATYLAGHTAEAEQLWTRAHNELLAAGDVEGAARSAMSLAVSLFERGEMAKGSGWAARAQRVLDEAQLDSPVRGYLLLPELIQRVTGGDAEGAYDVSQRMIEIAQRLQDLPLLVMSRHCQGRTLVQLGRISEGVALFDEVMVAITAGDAPPILAGDIYCSIIEACWEMYDLPRAAEWTRALGNWCATQPTLVPYTGQCLVHRAEIMILHGDWDDASEELLSARVRFGMLPDSPATGVVAYLQAELSRVRGDVKAAEDGYREASSWGHEPQPGLSLLRLAQGQTGAAEAAINRVVDEARDRTARPRLLAAQVEIALAAGKVDSARVAADELTRLAGESEASYLAAMSTQSEGAVLLAESAPRDALTALRAAWRHWRSVGAPYEAARTRAMLGLACRELGDEEGALLELEAARTALGLLGARPDADRVDELARGSSRPGTSCGITARELEVLRLVAVGKTNRAIAVDLFLSEKTVARHLSNIFSKLDLSSRSAATAYAFTHDLM